MTTKKTQPALYEKMRHRNGPIEVAAPPVRDLAEDDLAPSVPSVDTNWLQAGRLIRLPAGWVIVGAVVGVIAILLAYTTGHQRGQSAARAKFERGIASAAGASEDLTTLDPLVEPAPANGRGVLSYAPPGGDNKPAATNVARSASPSAWGPVEPKQDPRRKGLTYFILAETNQSGAVKLAEYCRASGLETYVVLAKNSRRQVIAFPGFPRSERLKPQVKALEAQIHEIGAKWKRNERGDSDLSDAYPLTFNG